MVSMLEQEQLSLDRERELVERAREGDGEAFGLIYDAHKRALFQTVIYPRLRSEKLSEEVLQETFLLAIEKIGSFEWQDRSVFFWLRMIAINKCRESISRKRRTATVDESVLEYQPDDRYQPEREVVDVDFQGVLRERIEEALKGIKDRYADAIRMRLIENKTREEAAAALEVSVETFDVVFFRACKSFRQEYIKKYGKI